MISLFKAGSTAPTLDKPRLSPLAEDFQRFGEMNLFASEYYYYLPDNTRNYLAGVGRVAKHRSKCVDSATDRDLHRLEKWCKQRGFFSNFFNAHTNETSPTTLDIYRDKGYIHNKHYKELEHELHRAIECPVPTRHLSKKGFQVYLRLIPLLKEKHKAYGFTLDGVPSVQQRAIIEHLRSQGFRIAWTVGVDAKEGYRTHTHGLLVAPSGISKYMILKALESLVPTWIEKIQDFVGYCIYMCENYDQVAPKGLLHRGQNRFSCNASMQILTREDKKYRHPRKTRAELERWETACERYRRRHGISSTCSKLWRWWFSDKIAEIANKIPLELGQIQATSHLDFQTYNLAIDKITVRHKRSGDVYHRLWYHSYSKAGKDLVVVATTTDEEGNALRYEKALTQVLQEMCLGLPIAQKRSV